MNRQSVCASRVLLVDGYPDSAETMAVVLKLWGYLPLVALDDITGLEMALSQRPDLIFLEVSLPGMDGCEVARRIRAEEGMEQTPLLARTGWGRPCDAQACLAAGFDRHLLKPVDPEELRRLQHDLVRLTAAANPFQAHIWQQALEREGIRCQVLGDYLDAGIGGIPGFSAEVWVETADLARAKAFLCQLRDLPKRRLSGRKTHKP